MTVQPPKSPQHKKALSYAKDRRNVYGENDKASRKAIPAQKAAENRKARRKASQALEIVERLDDAATDLLESSLRHDVERVGGWTKDADAPLLEYIEIQARRRSWRGLSPNRESLPEKNGS